MCVLPAVMSRGGYVASRGFVMGLVTEMVSTGEAAVMDFTC